MTDFNSPVGRLVQGSMKPSHQKDIESNQPLFNADGSPQMGVFFALAFPKILPSGQPNGEYQQFHELLKATAAAAWPQLFPQGAAGPCANPRFSWKIQDGDGHDHNGRSVADKAGFAGHWVVKFYTAFQVRCFHEGRFGPHEEIQNPDDVIKRGDWVRIFGEVKSNNATGNQVPGISLYPKLVSFVREGERIASGPDAATAFGGYTPSFVPPAPANSPIPTPGAASPPLAAPVVNPPTLQGLPTPPALPTPPVLTPPAPSYVVSPALAAQGVTIDSLLAQGWTHDTLVQHGHAVKVG